MTITTINLFSELSVHVILTRVNEINNLFPLQIQ